MTHSYTSPDTDPKDVVRFLLQDTNPAEWLLTDEEITYAIRKWFPIWGTFEYTASVLAENLAARYAREATYSADGVSISLGAVAQQFRDLAAELRSQHKDLLVGGSPDAGGISPYEGLYPGVKNFNFGVGMHDDLDAGRQNYGSRQYVPEYYDGDIGDYPTE